MTSEGKLAIPQYSPEPGTPRRLCIRSLPQEQASIVKAMHAWIKNRKIVGLTAINLYNSWLTQRLALLRSHPHYMWEYKGQNDPTRSTAFDWDLAEYTKAPDKIAAATFTSFDTEP
jgi:hypothetical protein